MSSIYAATDFAGAGDKTVFFEVWPDGSAHIVAVLSAEETEDSYLTVYQLWRWKILEWQVKERARKAIEDVINEIRRKFECLREGHDCFSVHDSQGDGMYTENFSYLECRNCGEQLPYDGRDDYDEPFFDDMEESPL